ncbi:MAG: DUF2779 domain-containing protein [Chitinophagales bacterium]
MRIKKNSLSKSTLIRSIQCPKSLYLYKNYFHLREKPDTPQQQRFDRGHRVGKLAQQLFPNGKDCSPPNPYSYDASIAATKALIQQQFPAIYEAAFKYNGILVALDILSFKDGKWYAHEVKSSIRISNTYLLDATIQYYIITKSGIALEDFSIITINSDYIFDKQLDVQQLFCSTSVLQEIRERIPFVENAIEKAIETLSQEKIPEVSIGAHCTKPYPCDFQQYCWIDITPDSVWYLPGLSMQEKSTLIETGIEKIQDIVITDALNSRQKVIIDAYQSKKIHLDKQALTAFVSTLQFPAYYFDIEAFQPAIPLFKGTKSYERIPFLYSLHYKENSESELEHVSYISPVGEDNRLAFIEHFLRATEKPGQILVFNTLLEKGILSKLMKEFPAYKKQLMERINRIVDIEIPFKELQIYHPEQQGSFSLKAIGKALLPKDEFSNSAVKTGEEAMAIYNELFYCNDEIEIKQKLEHLKTYCYFDTFVLFKVVEVLKKIVK